MTDATAAVPPTGRTRRLALIAILLIAAATLWWVAELYTTDAARACREMYAGARSGADTGRIDLIIPRSERDRPEPRTCADLRRATP